MKQTPFLLVKWVVRAFCASLGVDSAVGEGAGELAQSIAEDVWEGYFSRQDPKEQRRELEAVSQASPAQLLEAPEVREEIDQIKDPRQRKQVAAYVGAIPGTLRASLRRPADPSGRTVPSGMVPRSAVELSHMLPSQLPRFKEGDRPGCGDWELVELLGTGGFGEVWKARNPHLPGETVALKFCLDAQAARTLRREASLLARVREAGGQHPGIVRLRDTFLSLEPPCLSYEFVEGGTLAGLVTERQQEGRAFNSHEAAQFIHELAQIMAVCHSLPAPIVHRDLKPANILVERAVDGGTQLRITDFGIGGIAAQHSQDSRTGQKTFRSRQQSLPGSHTPLYASPEQCRGSEADVRDDVYALGVIWSQLLSGDLTRGASSGRWIQKLVAAGHPPKFVELLACCLEEAPERIASAGALAEQLGALLAESLPQSPNALTEAEPVPPRVLAGFAPGDPWEFDLGSGVIIVFCWMPAGKFVMGSPRAEPGRESDEDQVKVSLSQGWWLARTLCTQEQWAKVMGGNPSFFQGSQLPVENISWNECQQFLEKLATPTKGWHYALPTEAQWEYACRAGTAEPYAGDLDAMAWFRENSGRRTHPVASRQPNPWGLYDMHGNAWEWCADWYDEALAGGTNPAGPLRGTEKVFRGGSCRSTEAECRSSVRGRREPGFTHVDLSFRVALVPHT